MPQLTLDLGERKAIDWIGGRYEHGYDFWKLLLQCDWLPKTETVEDDVPYFDGPEWDESCDITFVPDDETYDKMKALLSDCNYECFCPTLIDKITTFLGNIT